MVTHTNVSHANALHAHLIAQLGAAVDDARGAAAAIGRDAITAASLAADATAAPAKAAREIARDLRNRASHAALNVVAIAVAAARADAFAEALVMHDEGHEAAELAARERVEAEGARDAETWRQARAEDPELEDASEWMVGAFDAWLEDEGALVFAPITTDEARARFYAAFLLAVRGAS